MCNYDQRNEKAIKNEMAVLSGSNRDSVCNPDCFNLSRHCNVRCRGDTGFVKFFCTSYLRLCFEAKGIVENHESEVQERKN